LLSRSRSRRGGGADLSVNWLIAAVIGSVDLVADAASPLPCSLAHRLSRALIKALNNFSSSVLDFSRSALLARPPSFSFFSILRLVPASSGKSALISMQYQVVLLAGVTLVLFLKRKSRLPL
jgi:hypothetical protein